MSFVVCVCRLSCASCCVVRVVLWLVSRVCRGVAIEGEGQGGGGRGPVMGGSGRVWG